MDRLRSAIRVRQYSRRTEEAYVAWVRQFIVRQGLRHPEAMGAPEVGAFLEWLATARRVSGSTQNQALSAILFMYREVIGRDLGALPSIPRARTPERLPVVFSHGEALRVIGQLGGVPRLVAMLLYGSGLRLLEALELRVKDVDFERGEIVVRQGKGLKDRVTMLPVAVRADLARHLELVRRQHEGDVRSGVGRVALPGRDRAQVSGRGTRVEVAVCVSCGTDLPGSAVGRAVAVPPARVGGAAGGDAGGADGGDYEAGELSHVPAFVCDAPAGGRV